MRIRIWKGYHSVELQALIQEAWDQEDLLILSPPLKSDFNFVPFLPPAENISLVGDWAPGAEEMLRIASTQPNKSPRYPDRPVLGVFTSGTISGIPRLVLYSKKNIEASLEAILGVFDRKRITSIFCYPQPFHTMGLNLGYVLASRLDVPLFTPDGKYSQASHEKRLSVSDPGLLTLGTPTHLFDLLRALESSRREIAPSYSCIVGGAPVAVDLWDQVQKRLRIEAPTIGYGCTEASPGITHHPPGLRPKESGEIGFPLPNLTSIPGANGVEISGPSLCLAIVTSDGIEFPHRLTIRDEIEVRPDRMWVYRGRCDLVINRGGVKLSLEHIENSIRKNFNLVSVCCGVEDERLGEELALVVLQENVANQTQATGDMTRNMASDLTAFLEASLQIRIPPSRLIFLPEFPLNDSSKVDRKAIARLFENCRRQIGAQP